MFSCFSARRREEEDVRGARLAARGVPKPSAESETGATEVGQHSFAETVGSELSSYFKPDGRRPDQEERAQKARHVTHKDPDAPVILPWQPPDATCSVNDLDHEEFKEEVSRLVKSFHHNDASPLPTPSSPLAAPPTTSYFGRTSATDVASGGGDSATGAPSPSARPRVTITEETARPQRTLALAPRVSNNGGGGSDAEDARRRSRASNKELDPAGSGSMGARSRIAATSSGGAGPSSPQPNGAGGNRLSTDSGAVDLLSEDSLRAGQHHSLRDSAASLASMRTSSRSLGPLNGPLAAAVGAAASGGCGGGGWPEGPTSPPVGSPPKTAASRPMPLQHALFEQARAVSSATPSPSSLDNLNASFKDMGPCARTSMSGAPIQAPGPRYSGPMSSNGGIGPGAGMSPLGGYDPGSPCAPQSPYRPPGSPFNGGPAQQQQQQQQQQQYQQQQGSPWAQSPGYYGGGGGGGGGNFAPPGFAPPGAAQLPQDYDSGQQRISASRGRMRTLANGSSDGSPTSASRQLYSMTSSAHLPSALNNDPSAAWGGPDGGGGPALSALPASLQSPTDRRVLGLNFSANYERPYGGMQHASPPARALGRNMTLAGGAGGGQAGGGYDAAALLAARPSTSQPLAARLSASGTAVPPAALLGAARMSAGGMAVPLSAQPAAPAAPPQAPSPPPALLLEEFLAAEAPQQAAPPPPPPPPPPAGDPQPPPVAAQAPPPPPPPPAAAAAAAAPAQPPPPPPPHAAEPQAAPPPPPPAAPQSQAQVPAPALAAQPNLITAAS